LGNKGLNGKLFRLRSTLYKLTTSQSTADWHHWHRAWEKWPWIDDQPGGFLVVLSRRVRVMVEKASV